MDANILVLIIAIFIPLFFLFLSTKKTFSRSEFQASGKQLDSDEVLIGVVSDIRLWNRETPGRTILDSHIGVVALTDKRLVFLSSGHSGTARIIAGAFIGGKIDYELIAGVLDKRDAEHAQSFNQLKNKGSLDIPFERIREVGVHKNSRTYLLITYEDDSAIHPACFVSDKPRSRHSAIKGTARRLEEAISNWNGLKYGA